jgi:hypothetical protein
LSDAIERIGESGGVLLGIVINRVPRGRLQRDSYPSSKASRRATPIGGSHANPQEPPPQAAALTEVTKVQATDVSSAGGVTTSTSDIFDF